MITLPVLETTLYPRTVRTAPADPTKSTGLRVFKAAEWNAKLGKGRISKGPRAYRGRKLYSLTLVERVTCPSTCLHWRTCYGNNMPFAFRYAPGPELVSAIRADVTTLADRQPGGFVVRLHVLGDFYSVPYVREWGRLLARYDALRVYGYTHRPHGSRIGNAVASVCAEYPERFNVLRSDRTCATDPLAGAYSVMAGDDPPAGVVVCPEQTGRVESCAACMLCAHGSISVAFLQH